MSLPEDGAGDGYGRQHAAYQCWLPQGATPEMSPTGQDYYLESITRNAESIRKCTLDSLFRELCPVWKPAIPGSPSLFDNNAQ